MRVLCRHGHVAFYPDYATEISKFSEYYGLDLVLEGDYYTFRNLAGAPDYSLIGLPYLNLEGLVVYQGKPWEVMRENGFVYSERAGGLVLKDEVEATVELERSSRYFVAPGAYVAPGSVLPGGERVLSYDAIFSQGFKRMILIGWSHD